MVEKFPPGQAPARIAAELRRRIISGEYGAGHPVRDGDIAKEMNVSRNTVRESLSLLRYMRLLDHQVNRGFFVRVLSLADVHDIYRVRRTLELRAIRISATVSDSALRGVEAAVLRGESAAERSGWLETAAASLDFHKSLVGLLESPSLSELFENVLAQMQLAFALAKDPGELQASWIRRDRELIDLLKAGQRREAEDYLSRYLEESEEGMCDLVRAGLYNKTELQRRAAAKAAAAAAAEAQRQATESAY